MQMLAFKCLHGFAPGYLAQRVEWHVAKEYNMLPLEAREMPTTDFLTFLKKHFS